MRNGNPKIHLASTQNCNPLPIIVSHGCKVTTLTICYFNDVQSTNDGHLQTFFQIYSSKVTLHSHEMATPQKLPRFYVKPQSPTQSCLAWMQGDYFD